MSEVLRMPDGYGGYVGDRLRMRAKPGSHVAYARGPDVVVEWYDFGDHAPYESANLLVFDRAAQLKLMPLLRGQRLGLTAHELACDVASEFDSYFTVKAFAQANAIPFTTETDFQP